MDRDEQQKIIREAVHYAMRPFIYVFVAAAIITVWLNWVLDAYVGIALIKQTAHSPTQNLALAIFGTLCAIVYGRREVVRSRVLVERGVETEGVVDAISPLRKDELGPVTVTFNANGQTHTFRKDLIVSDFQVGQTVRVVYDREAPDRCDVFSTRRKPDALTPLSVAAGRWVRQAIASTVTDPKYIFIALICAAVLISRRFFPGVELSSYYVVTAALLFVAIALLIMVLMQSITAKSRNKTRGELRFNLACAAALLVGAGVSAIVEPTVHHAMEPPPAVFHQRRPTEFQRSLSNPRVQEGLRLLQQVHRPQTRQAESQPVGEHESTK